MERGRRSADGEQGWSELGTPLPWGAVTGILKIDLLKGVIV
jgi:hypothetical protein